MRGFIVLCTFAALTVAAPQQGYRYTALPLGEQLAQTMPQPHKQYGVTPSNTAEVFKDLQTVMAVQSGNLGPNFELNTQPQLANFSSEQHAMTNVGGAALAPVSAVRNPASYLAPALSAMNFSQQQQQVHSLQQQQSQQLQQATLTHQQISQSYLQKQQQVADPETVISKRFYIHSAPADDDDEVKERHVTVGKPRKIYNIVFIKSSDKAAKKASIKITPAVNEEKTVIYVLNKKHDAADIDAQVYEPITTTAKPEVYFIKYKTAEEAAHAQQSIRAQYDALGGSTQVNNEGVAPVSSVIDSLDTERHAEDERAHASTTAQGGDQQTLQIPALSAAGAQPQEQMLSAQLPLLQNVNKNNGYLPPARYYL